MSEHIKAVLIIVGASAVALGLISFLAPWVAALLFAIR